MRLPNNGTTRKTKMVLPNRDHYFWYAPGPQFSADGIRAVNRLVPAVNFN